MLFICLVSSGGSQLEEAVQFILTHLRKSVPVAYWISRCREPGEIVIDDLKWDDNIKLNLGQQAVEM
jgi:hypothetical protein